MHPLQFLDWVLHFTNGIFIDALMLLAFFIFNLWATMTLYHRGMLPRTRPFKRIEQVKDAEHRIRMARMTAAENKELDKIRTMGEISSGN